MLYSDNPFMRKKRKMISSQERNRGGIQFEGRHMINTDDRTGRYRTVNDYYKNWTDVFGTDSWFVPMYATAPTCDGYHWTLSH